MNSRSHNSAYSRLMVLSELGQNSVAPEGRGSLRLANGQVGIFRLASKSANGATAVDSLDGYSGKELFQIQVGTGRTQEAGGMTNKNFATIPFTREDILDVTFDTAKAPVYSEVTLGYNGTAGTGIKLKENEATTVSLKLFGEQLSYLGFRDGVAQMTFNVFSGSPDECSNCLGVCSDTSCQSIVEDLVETIREYELRAGSDMGTGASIKVGDLVEVIGTSSCKPELVAASTVTTYSLTREDMGTAEALAQVAAQYSALTVERISREGITSVYQTLAPLTPIDFSEPVNSILDEDGHEREVRVLEDCAECPAGFSELGGGFIYKLVVPEAGDVSGLDTTIIAAFTAVTSVDTRDTLERGVGPIGTREVILVLNAEVDLATLITTIAGDATLGADANEIEVSLVSDSDAVCISDSDYSNTIAWDAGEVCDIFTKTIELDVDLDCGPFATAAARTAAANAKLAELQGIYSDLSVALSTADIGECRARFTGTLTSAPVCEGCETEDAIFPDMPADYEFSAWSERTPNAGEITSFTVALTSGAITASEAFDVDEADDAVTAGSGSAPAGAEFDINVALSTTAVDSFVVKLDASAPSSGFSVGDTIVIDTAESPFGGTNTAVLTVTITGVGGEYPDDCECGIKFVAKNAFLCPPAMLADQIGTFTPKGVKIQVSGGEAPSVLMEGYEFVTTPFRVTRHERDFDGTSWGINYMKQEKASAEYFAGISPRRSYAEGYLSGFETKLEPCVQYDKFTVKLKRNPYAGTASRRMGEEIRYVFLIPQGGSCLYQGMIEALGGALDCPTPDAD